MTNQELLKEAVARLTDWFPSHKKDLPWRNDPTPYHVWISEIMLQQTRIAAVIPYYHRFLAALPNVEALAKAEETEVFKLWEGLGYYSRARNLRKGAIAVMSDFGGELPKTAAELQKIPGIGAYTAGAIASIAFGQPSPAVDGNVLRVVMRLLADDADIASEKVKDSVRNALSAVYPTGENAAIATQAIMELGETVCLPGTAADCNGCPLRDVCRAKKGEVVALLPAKAPKKPRRIEEKTVLVISDENGDAALRRRPDSGLLAGLFEFPNSEGKKSAEDVRNELEKDGVCVESVLPMGEAVHVFTHLEWHMVGYRIRVRNPVYLPGIIFVCKEKLSKEYAMPTALRFYKEKLLSE